MSDVTHTPPPIHLTKNESPLPLVFVTETKGVGGPRSFYSYDINQKDASGHIVYETDKEGKRKVEIKDGKEQPIPVTQLPSTESIIKIIGDAVAQKKLFIVLKKGLKEVYDRVMENTISEEFPAGKFDQKMYEAELSAYSWVSISLKSLKEQQLELTNLLLLEKISVDEWRRQARVVGAQIKAKQTVLPEDDDDEAVVA